MPRLVQPQINYEIKITSDNLRALLANLPSGDEGAASESAETVLRALLNSIGAANLPSLDQVRQGVENRARRV